MLISALSSVIERAAVAWSRTCFLGFFELSLRGVFEVLEVFGVEVRRRHRHGLDRARALQDLQLAQPLFETLTSSPERLVDRLRRRGQTALQDGQGEPDGASALVVLERLGPVELFAHVFGDGSL